MLRIRRLPRLCLLALLWTFIPAAEAAEAEPTQGGPSDAFFSVLEWIRSWTTDDAQRVQDAPESRSSQREQPDDRRDVTLGHVHRAILDLSAEIELLRHALGVSDLPRAFELRRGVLPIHAYVKSIEVMEKVARLQERFNLTPIEAGRMPVGSVGPADAYHNVDAAIEGVRKMKGQLVIEREIRPARPSGAKSAAFVYKQLGDVSSLLDGLVGRTISAEDIHARISMIHRHMLAIAASFGVVLEVAPLETGRNRQMREVAQQVLRSMFKVVELQSVLGMGISSVSNLELDRTTPARVLDATNILLAEVLRIGFHVKSRLPEVQPRASRISDSADLFSEMLLVVRNLDRMIEAASSFE